MVVDYRSMTVLHIFGGWAVSNKKQANDYTMSDNKFNPNRPTERAPQLYVKTNHDLKYHQ